VEPQDIVAKRQLWNLKTPKLPANQ